MEQYLIKSTLSCPANIDIFLAADLETSIWGTILIVDQKLEGSFGPLGRYGQSTALKQLQLLAPRTNWIEGSID